jgi:hypothetical protein
MECLSTYVLYVAKVLESRYPTQARRADLRQGPGNRARTRARARGACRRHWQRARTNDERAQSVCTQAMHSLKVRAQGGIPGSMRSGEKIMSRTYLRFDPSRQDGVTVTVRSFASNTVRDA